MGAQVSQVQTKVSKQLLMQNKVSSELHSQFVDGVAGNNATEQAVAASAVLEQQRGVSGFDALGIPEWPASAYCREADEPSSECLPDATDSFDANVPLKH